MRMTLSHLYLEAKLEALDTLGFSQTRALNYLGMDVATLKDHQNRLSVDAFLGLLNMAAEVLEEDNLGLRLGNMFRVATFSQTGNVYGYAKCLKEVIDLNARYQPLAIDAVKIEYVLDNGRHYMRMRPYYDDLEKYRHITDLIMGAYVTAFRWLSWSSGTDIQTVRLPYGPRPDRSFHDTVFRCPIEFNRQAGCLEFPQAAMDQNLPTHDPERLSRAKAQLNKLLGTQDARESLDDAVDAAIRGAIGSGHVTSHIVAERLGKTWQELRKDLKDTDRGFRDRLDHVRRLMFVELHAQGISFAQISQDLAYNDQSALNRAFKRWYGMSPTQWQAAGSPMEAD